MFEQTFVQTQAQTRRPWTVAVSLSLQCLVVGVLLLIPLLHPDVLRTPAPPSPHMLRAWLTQPPLPPPSNSAPITASHSTTVPRIMTPLQNTPPRTARSIDIPVADNEVMTWTGSLTSGGVNFGPSLETGSALPPRAADKASGPVRTAPVGPMRVSEGVQGAMLLYGPRPAYPPLAKTAHSQGVVRMEAIIAADGTIRDLRVLSGPPLFVEAARDAVRQWRYKPTMLSGVAVEVLTEIDVNFTLSR